MIGLLQPYLIYLKAGILIIAIVLLAWHAYSSLSAERDQLLIDKAELSVKVSSLQSQITTLKSDHDRQIAAITKLDQDKSAISLMMAPLVTQSDLLVFSKETPDAPDRFVRDLNALNGNLIRMLDENANGAGAGQAQPVSSIPAGPAQPRD